MVLSRVKRRTTIFLTLVFIYNTFGFLLVQPILINYFEYLGLQRAAYPSKEDKIELVILNKENIRLNKINFKKINAEEFKLNGKYFDIVKEVEQDSLIYFYCLNDEREDALEKEFQKSIDENTANKKQKPDNGNPFKSIVSEPVCYLTFNPMNAEHSRYKSYNDEIFNNNIEDVLTPPPKFFSAI